jgi:plasmid stabilization system protein ParE
VRRAVFLASARADLVQIVDYVVDNGGSAEVAEAFAKRLRAQCDRLAAYKTTMGRPRNELLPDLRSFPFLGYVIFFRYAGKRFEVVNIFGGHRDISALFEAERQKPSGPDADQR